MICGGRTNYGRLIKGRIDGWMGAEKPHRYP